MCIPVCVCVCFCMYLIHVCARCHVCQDDLYEHDGAHVFLLGGNLRLLQGLARGLPVTYNTPARLVQYCSHGVSMHQVLWYSTAWQTRVYSRSGGAMLPFIIRMTQDDIRTPADE